MLSVAASIHLLTAITRSLAPRDDGAPVDARDALVGAAREVGPGCFWAAVTTLAGFGSFLWSDLVSFRDFGVLSSIGIVVAYLVTFTLLPALLHAPLVRSARRPERRPGRALPDEILGAVRTTVARYPRFVLVACLAAFGLLATGAARLHYANDFGFGE